MRNRLRAIFLVMSSLVIAVGLVYADLKKGYYSTCHSPRYITMQPPLPAATWESEVNKMNKTFGAGIPEENARKIILYLQAHYTAENHKR